MPDDRTGPPCACPRDMEGDCAKCRRTLIEMTHEGLKHVLAIMQLSKRRESICEACRFDYIDASLATIMRQLAPHGTYQELLEAARVVMSSFSADNVSWPETELALFEIEKEKRA